MLMKKRICSLALVGALTTTVATTTATADDEALLIHSAGLQGMLVDGKDQGLARALRMIDRRIAELPSELDEQDMPVPAMQLALEVLRSPMTLRVHMNDDPGAAMPFSVHLAVRGDDADHTQSLSDRIKGYMGMIAPAPIEPVDGRAGFSQVVTPEATVQFGMVGRDADAQFVLTVNQPTIEMPAIGSMGLPRGVEPAWAMTLDMQQLGPFLDMMMSQAGPDADMMRQQLRAGGLIGPDAMTVSFAAGYADDRTHIVGTLANVARQYRESGLLTDRTLDAAHLRLVPADATLAQVSMGEFTGMGHYLNDMFTQMAQAMNEDPDGTAFDMVAQQIGIHPQRDFFDHLGNVSAFYMSDTTGGGGLLSAVMMFEITDAGAMRETFGQVESQINAITQQLARGYIRVHSTRQGDARVSTLTFPGVPIPLEVTYAITDGYFIVGATPQALAAAAAQISRPGPSLADRNDFMQAIGGSLRGATQVQFSDTARRARDGYGITSLVMSALRNAVRSPIDAERQPDAIMPTYAGLLEGVRPSVMVTRIDGDDMHFTGQCDRSMLVNLASVMGSAELIGGIAAAGAMAGITMPAMAQAREAARQTRAMAQLRQIAQAVHIHGSEHNNRMPDSLEVLVDAHYITSDILDSGVGDVWDGEGDYWLNTSIGRLDDVRFPDATILLYDRASYAMGDNVIVVFVDGHARAVPHWEFHNMINDERTHEGVDFNLP